MFSGNFFIHALMLEEEGRDMFERENEEEMRKWGKGVLRRILQEFFLDSYAFLRQRNEEEINISDMSDFIEEWLGKGFPDQKKNWEK